MSNSWIKDVTWSSRLFETCAWDAVKEMIGGGDLLSVESQSDEMRRRLDRFAGIDYWQVLPDGSVRGLASRVQDGVDYRTFSIRFSRASGTETEWEKRKRAVRAEGVLYPYYSIQAYFETREGGLLSVGVARTIDIVDYVEDVVPSILDCSNASFIVCPWSDMIARGYGVRTWYAKNKEISK